MLISIESEDSDSVEEIKASIGAKGNVGIAKLSADAVSRLSKTSSQFSSDISIKAKSSGFSSRVSMADLAVSKEITEELFRSVDVVKADLDNAFDKAYAEAKAGGTSTLPVTGIEIGFYDGLEGAGAASVYEIIDERMKHIALYIQDWSELQERMYDLYVSEMGPFLDTQDPVEQSRYQVAPPGKPRFTAAEVRAVLEAEPNSEKCGEEHPDMCSWYERLYPGPKPQVGWELQRVKERLRQCWDGGRTNIFAEECSTDSGRIVTDDDTDEWGELEDVIKTYAATARVLPMRVKVGEAVDGAEADEHCRETFQSDYRLPVLKDADVSRDSNYPNSANVVGGEPAFIAPMVYSAGNFRGGSPAHRVWLQHADNTSFCASLGFDTTYSYYPILVHHPNEDGPRVTCEVDSWVGGFSDNIVALCLGAQLRLPPP
jgi:hypothetical protein